MSNYRSEKLLAAVRTLPCQRCGAYGSQAAHSNQLRDSKGMGIKSHDYRIAALCPLCHTEIDSGTGMTKGERREAWEEAHRATVGELFARGLIRPV